MTKLFSILFFSVVTFGSCKTQERTSLKEENRFLKLTNTNCKNCRTHDGDYEVFEVSYLIEKQDSLKKEDLKLNAYTNTGHNSSDLNVINYELCRTPDKYILKINYQDANKKYKKKKIRWSIKRGKTLINESW